MSQDIAVDLPLDLNTMDETGLPWTFLDRSPDPERIVVGEYVIVGGGTALAVARVVDVADGIVHVLPLEGSVAANAHHLGRPYHAS